MSSYSNMLQLYSRNIVEVKVIRRRPKSQRMNIDLNRAGIGPTRKFLCTTNRLLLNSIAGKAAFHFRAPTQRPPYNAKDYNLVTVYDLLMQDWRQVNLNSDKILAAMPVTNKEEIAVFWEYFATVLSKWSSNQKSMFMNM